MLVASLMLATMAGVGYALAQAPASTPPDSVAPPPAAQPASTPAATTEAAPAPAAATEAAPAQAAPAATPAPAERIAALKALLQKDHAALKHYQWVETTTMSLKGEVKSTKQNNCYYGADGKLTKVPVGGDEAEAKKKRGIRGRVVENKTEEITAYMTKAAKAIKSYIPPDPAKLQASKDAGKAALNVLDPGKRARVDFKDYKVPGDVLGIEFDLVTNRLLGLNVTTMVEGGTQPVTFHSQYGSLADGTGYPMKTTLDAKEMGVTIVVENSGYKAAAK